MLHQPYHSDHHLFAVSAEGAGGGCVRGRGEPLERDAQGVPALGKAGPGSCFDLPDCRGMEFLVPGHGVPEQFQAAPYSDLSETDTCRADELHRESAGKVRLYGGGYGKGRDGNYVIAPAKIRCHHGGYDSNCMCIPDFPEIFCKGCHDGVAEGIVSE